MPQSDSIHIPPHIDSHRRQGDRVQRRHVVVVVAAASNAQHVSWVCVSVIKPEGSGGDDGVRRRSEWAVARVSHAVDTRTMF